MLCTICNKWCKVEAHGDIDDRKSPQVQYLHRKPKYVYFIANQLNAIPTFELYFGCH
jgi:hypothetical protein